MKSQNWKNEGYYKDIYYMSGCFGFWTYLLNGLASKNSGQGIACRAKQISCIYVYQFKHKGVKDNNNNNSSTFLVNKVFHSTAKLPNQQKQSLLNDYTRLYRATAKSKLSDKETSKGGYK